jgi:hypothetical protein
MDHPRHVSAGSSCRHARFRRYEKSNRTLDTSAADVRRSVAPPRAKTWGAPQSGPVSAQSTEQGPRKRSRAPGLVRSLPVPPPNVGRPPRSARTSCEPRRHPRARRQMRAPRRCRQRRRPCRHPGDSHTGARRDEQRSRPARHRMALRPSLALEPRRSAPGRLFTPAHRASHASSGAGATLSRRVRCDCVEAFEYIHIDVFARRFGPYFGVADWPLWLRDFTRSRQDEYPE